MRNIGYGLIVWCCWSLTAAAQVPSKEGVQVFTYRKTNQAELELHVHYPPAWKEGDKRPAIVFFFGGGWTSGSLKQFEPQAKYLASRGMVAVRADYRVRSRHGVTPDQCVDDARAAMRWVRQNAAKHGIDPQRIVAAGGSAGGHLAACTTLADYTKDADEAKTSARANALVLFNPVLRFDGVTQLMVRIDNNQVLGKALSPNLHLTKQSPPTLLFFGTSDKLLAQGEEFVKKAKELGQPTEMFTAEGQPHGFFNRPPWQERTLERVDSFLVSLGYLQRKAK